MAEIIYRSMSLEDTDQVRDLYYAFWRSEPLAMALGVEVPRECKRYVDFFLPKILQNKVGIAAVDTSTNAIVGINVCVISTPGNHQEPIYAPDDKDCEKLRKDDEILKHLAIAPDLFKHYNVDRIVESRGMYVRTEYGGRGIGTELFRKSLEIASQLGVRLAVIDCTSSYSRKIFDKLGFETVSELRLVDYKDVVNLNIPEDSPHQTGTLHVKRL